MTLSREIDLLEGQEVASSSSLIHAFLSQTRHKPTKALILLLHGVGGDHYHFDGLISPLVEAGFDVLVPDLPFHGQSQPTTDVASPPSPPPVLSFASMMDDLEILLKDIRPRFKERTVNLIVGGLSMGGMLSQACAIHKRSIWAAQHGYSMTGLIPIACPSVNMLFPRIRWMDMYRGAQQDTTTKVLNLAREFIIASAVHPRARDETARALALITDMVLAQCFRACANALPQPDQDDDGNKASLPRFDTLPPQLPTLLITGDQDEHTVVVMTAWQQLNETNGIMESRFCIKEDAGHMVPLDQPAAVAEDIVAFFSSRQRQNSLEMLIVI